MTRPTATRSRIAVRRTALLLAATVTGGWLLATPAQAAYGDTEFRSVSINNGKPVVLGTTGTVTVPVSALIHDDSGGVETIDADLAGTFLEGPVSHNMTCVRTTSTESTCTGTAILDPATYSNDSPGPIGLRIFGYAYDGGQYLESTLYPQYADLPGADALLLKETRLAAMNAAPEPVRKGGTLTFTGRLTRPDWNATEADGTKAVVGYSGQPVKLQFKKSGGTSYSTVRTVTSGSDGKLRTTAEASTGTWRWLFAQNGTSSAATSTGDGVTLLKASKLTVDASPEPVAKGAALTVTGRLTRATTDAATAFTGYAGQPVKLQFRKSGSTTYTTIKTVRTDTTGHLHTTVTAKAAGHWRWSYAGSDTVASVNAAGDGVALR
ncbi:hypothetical protein ACIRQQ_31500 [Streptomyces fuscichromogenes]|uniref:hypothetical protein n=1 Tax=Streptomyces fuscichromogenes TaxID=1324013 RepID=UPI0038141F50